MKFRTIHAMAIFLIFLSCTSDPCEDITCINGDCIDGICQCSEGFYGEFCDVTKLAGLYIISKFQHRECAEYKEQYDLTSPANSPSVCGPNSEGKNVCFNWTYTIKEDGRISRFQSNTIEISPGKRESQSIEFIHGTYNIRNERIAVKLENGEIFDLLLDKDKLTRLAISTNGGNKCMIIEEYIRK